MESLKLLVEMVASLPTMAVWVIIGYFIYKIFIVGSVYGVIRFVTQKIHDVIVAKKTEAARPVHDVTPMLDGMVITGEKEHFLFQLRRIAGKGTGIKSDYIHHASVEWLRGAIDDKIAKDLSNEKEKAA